MGTSRHSIKACCSNGGVHQMKQVLKNSFETATHHRVRVLVCVCVLIKERAGTRPQRNVMWKMC